MKMGAQHKAGNEGFTLIEVLLALAVSAIVGTLAISILLQFVNVSAAEQDTMIVSSQLKSLSSVLSQDLVCAASGEVLDDGQVLILNLTEFQFGQLIEPTAVSLSYSVVDNELIRTSQEGSVAVARGVQSVSFGDDGSLGEVCTVDITITVGETTDSTTIILQRRPS